MRVLVIADAKVPVPPDGYGGTERMVALLCAGLAARGHQVMAAGVSVVASAVGACREVLDDGAHVMLVPPRDSVALANAIERIRDQPDAAAARAERARRKAFEAFDAERTAAACAEVLGLHAAGAAPAAKAA